MRAVKKRDEGGYREQEIMEYADGTVARAADGTALPVGPVLYAANK